MASTATNGAPGDGKSTVEKGVNDQYDTDASMAFYEYVMGGGGDDIHYGIFNSDSDGLKESSQNSVEALAAMAEACGGLKKVADGEPIKVLDLGSGKGGAARWLAKTYGCHVTCFNLGEKQNEFNKNKAVADGIGELIEPTLGSFNEPLPQKWTDQFDMVWSQEAFCHAMDHNALIAEVQRVLKPGGTAVFSDIMQSDNGGDCTSFTGQNVTTKLASPATYKEAIKTTGMKLCEYKDLTHHLTKYFQCMLEAVKESKLPLQMRGVSLARLEAYEEDLVVRFDAVKQRSFAWGMFSCQNLFSSDALLNGATYGTEQCQDQMEENK